MNERREQTETRFRLVVILPVLAGLAAVPAHASILYSVTDLGVGTGAPIAAAINNNGQVVGTTGSGLAFLYSGGSVTTLSLGGASGEALGINAGGQVVGYAVPAGGGTAHAFLFSNGSIADLGLEGGNSSEATAINDLSQVVGISNAGLAGNLVTFLYSGGVSTQLFVPPCTPGYLCYPDYGYIPNAINDSGEIAGSECYVYCYAFVANIGGLPSYITSSGLSKSTSQQGEAFGVNSSGEVVGCLGTQAFSFLNGNVSLFGATNACAYGVNNSGEIVGYESSFYSYSTAFVDIGGVVTDLNSLIDPSLGIHLTSANGVNDRGQIIANTNGGGAYLLTPISESSSTPEPGSLALLSAGLGVFCLLRTRHV